MATARMPTPRTWARAPSVPMARMAATPGRTTWRRLMPRGPKASTATPTPEPPANITTTYTRAQTATSTVRIRRPGGIATATPAARGTTRLRRLITRNCRTTRCRARWAACPPGAPAAANEELKHDPLLDDRRAARRHDHGCRRSCAATPQSRRRPRDRELLRHDDRRPVSLDGSRPKRSEVRGLHARGKRLHEGDARAARPAARQTARPHPAAQQCRACVFELAARRRTSLLSRNRSRAVDRVAARPRRQRHRAHALRP